jgi:hypothetical protein
VSKIDVVMEIFYSKTMESFLSIIIEPWLPTILEENEWLNVRNAECRFLVPEKLGRWLDAQTEQAKECSWK